MAGLWDSFKEMFGGQPAGPAQTDRRDFRQKVFETIDPPLQSAADNIRYYAGPHGTRALENIGSIFSMFAPGSGTVESGQNSIDAARAIEQGNYGTAAKDMALGTVNAASDWGGPVAKTMKAMIIPAAMSRFAPATGEAERLIKAGDHQGAWDATQSQKSGINGVFQRADGPIAFETNDRSLFAKTGELQSTANRLQKDGWTKGTPIPDQFTVPITDVVGRTDLFSHVPDLKDYRVAGVPYQPGLPGGWHDRSNRLMTVVAEPSGKIDPLWAKTTMQHEMQHGIDSLAKSGGYGVNSSGSNPALFEALSPEQLGTIGVRFSTLDKAGYTAPGYERMRDVWNANVPTNTMTGKPLITVDEIAKRLYMNDLGETYARMSGLGAVRAKRGGDEWAEWLMVNPNVRASMEPAIGYSPYGGTQPHMLHALGDNGAGLSDELIAAMGNRPADFTRFTARFPD